MTDLDPRRWRALALLCTAAFMVILDSQIVILALPSIERDLGLDEAGAQWVLSAYLLGFGGMLLLGGRAADRLGRRRVFLGGTALFLVSSLLCGFAWAGGILVGARVLQGVSAAMMMPSALSIVTTTFQEGAERNRALAIWSAVGGFGGTAALLVGGGVTGSLGWEWIFFLNVPFALGMLVLGPRLLRESRTHARTFDPAGAVTVTAALAAGVYAVVQAPAEGWESARTIGLATASLLLFALFVRVESRSEAPLVPLRIFASRTFTGGNLVTLMVAMTVFGTSFAVTQFSQGVLGYSPLTFGFAAVPLPVMAVAGAYGGQALVTRLGPGPVAAAGMVLMALGALSLVRVTAGGGYAGVILPGMAVLGLGLGTASVAAPVAVFTGVAEHESGLASGINTAAFQVGGAIGVAISSTVAVSRTGASHDPSVITGGFRAAFGTTSGLALLGVLVAVVLLVRLGRVPEPVPE